MSVACTDIKSTLYVEARLIEDILQINNTTQLTFIKLIQSVVHPDATIIIVQYSSHATIIQIYLCII